MGNERLKPTEGLAYKEFRREGVTFFCVSVQDGARNGYRRGEIVRKSKLRLLRCGSSFRAKFNTSWGWSPQICALLKGFD